jgi:hypothetical protein
MKLLAELLPLLFAAGCIAAACMQGKFRYFRIRHPVYTQGEIVGCAVQKAYRCRSEAELVAPIIRYTTEQGEQSLVYRHFVPEWQYRYRNGESVKICYDRVHPEIFHICSDKSSLCRWFLLALGICTLFAYAVLWVQYYF